MITNTIINWFQAIVQFIYNLFPDPALTGGVNSAQYAIDTINSTIDSIVGGGLAALSNGPLTVAIDWTILSFTVAVIVALFLIYFIVETLEKAWKLIKI